MSEDNKRIAAPGYGVLIDRSRPLTFTFDDKLYNGYAGDVIASALVAEGRSTLSRSFKYHRPRGALTMAGHDVNTLMQVAEEPNVRADLYPLANGIAVKSINTFGSLDRDYMSGLGYFSRFLPVGFYYKTFFRPAWAWKLWEKPIRALAGLGWLEEKAQHKYYDKAYLFTDVMVVGGGPAGLNAAISAAEAGAETLLVDEWPELGGSLLYGRAAGSRAAAEAERQALVAKARSLPNLTIMTSATLSGMFADNWASILQGNRLFKVRAKQTVLACGAFDQPLVFKNNDLPGVMFADAAQRLMGLYGVLPGHKAVIATSNRYGYEAAFDLIDAGASVAAIVDLNAEPEASLLDAARKRGIRVIPKSTIVEARADKARLSGVAVAGIAAFGQAAASSEWLSCDLLLMSVGYSPALSLASHAGAKIAFDTRLNMHRVASCPEGLSVAGILAGQWSAERVAAQAQAAGRRAAALALGNASSPLVIEDDPEAARVTHDYPIFASKSGKDFIDFDEDLQVRDIVNTIKDGYDDIQLVKRYSTEGFGPSQGRHAHLNTIRIVARETKKSLEAVGTTTFRPPLVPEKFAYLAGRAFEPTRLTSMHNRHLELGAQMMTAGVWMRPAYYGGKASAASAIAAEVKAVREGVGLIDVSTLGGIEVRGPDAAAFLDRMYTWAYAKQPIGRARYTLMTDATGVVIDDGVAGRLHEQHYYVTATTGAVDQVYRAMTWNNVQWKLNVDIANVTAAYSAVNIAGPKARAVVEKLASDIDFSKDAFPYMAVRTGKLGGIPVRVMRVGFVGELGYEIHCPSGYGEALWDALMQAGQEFGIRPFGVEAQRILRLEKGHIIVGQDTDGLTTPVEANMEWALKKSQAPYVGRHAIIKQREKKQTRQLAGFYLSDGAAAIPKECHLVIRNGEIAGRVTSIARSPTMKKVLGLAYLPPDLCQPGTQFEIRADKGVMVSATVQAAPFYDPENKRQEM